jgi:hypothetical protein
MAKTYAQVKALAKKIVRIKPDPIMEEFRKMFEEMAVHTRKRKPEDKLLRARPNEPGSIQEYRNDNFESITYGSMINAFDTLFRIFTSVGIQVQTGDEESDKYLNEPNFMRETFMMFYIKIYMKRMIEDANGWLLWLPGGVGSTTRGATVEPYPELMFSFDLIDWEDDYMVFLSKERSLIEINDGVERIGNIYYILTDTEFYTHTEMTGGKYELELKYQHKFGVVPAIPLGGDVDADGLYQSFFEPFVAHGNEAIRQFSDWQALSVMAAHPIREEFQVNCQITELKKKKVRKGTSADIEGQNDLTEYKIMNQLVPMPTSIFGTIIRNGSTSDSEMGSAVLDPKIPSVRFISPDIAYVKNAFETYQRLLEIARESLNLDKTTNGITEQAKKLDVQSEEDMLTKIFLQLIDSMKKSAQFIVAYRKITKPSKTAVKVIRPASFRIKTEVELMEELTKLKVSNAPTMLICAVARELAMLRFSGDELNQKIFEIIATYDVLFTYSPGEKQSMFLANTASKEDVTNSNYIYSVLLSMAKQKGHLVFMEMDSEKLYNEFLKSVKIHYTKDSIITDNQGNAI